MQLLTDLKLSPKFVRSVRIAGLPWLILGGLLFMANLGYQGDLLWQIRQEAQLWESGHDAGQAAVRGQKYTRYSLFSEYDFEVIYNDAAYKVYHRPLRFSALQSEIAEDLAPSVKYDPEDPTRFAVSWGVSQQDSRLAAIALFGSFWALFSLLLAWLGYQKLRLLRDARSAIKEPVIKHLAILHQKKERATTSYVYQVEAPKRRAEILFTDKEPRPLLAGDPPQLVAIANAKRPAQHVILCEDGFPLDLTSQALLAALSASPDLTPE